MDVVIETKSVSKSFGKVTAVDQVNLSVGQGEIYGFLGLNGAGKTTTIRMLLGMISPTSGSIRINGQKVGSNSTSLWKQIGYMVETPYSYPELTIVENLEIVCRMRGIRSEDSIKKVMERLEISEYHNRKVKNLSQGNNQRLGIAKAIIHNPNILILDEPTNGLDPAGIADIRELLNDLVENHGVTVLLSSHILGEISKFATRIGIIDKGKMVQEINQNELQTVLKRVLTVSTLDNMSAGKFLESKGIRFRLNDAGYLELSDEKSLRNPELIASTLVYAGYAPKLLNLQEEDLESYFLRIIGVNGGTK